MGIGLKKFQGFFSFLRLGMHLVCTKKQKIQLFTIFFHKLARL